MVSNQEDPSVVVCKRLPYSVFQEKSCLSGMRLSMITLYVILAVLKIKCTKVVGKEKYQTEIFH